MNPYTTVKTIFQEALLKIVVVNKKAPMCCLRGFLYFKDFYYLVTMSAFFAALLASHGCQVAIEQVHAAFIFADQV